jgi:hypothetical protein
LILRDAPRWGYWDKFAGDELLSANEGFREKNQSTMVRSIGIGARAEYSVMISR